jgi:hypothetical protein
MNSEKISLASWRQARGFKFWPWLRMKPGLLCLSFTWPAFLLIAALWAPGALAASPEVLAPASEAEEKPPLLNLEELLPSSRETPESYNLYSITDKPPGRAARPPASAPDREALPAAEGEAAPQAAALAAEPRELPADSQAAMPEQPPETRQSAQASAAAVRAKLSLLEGCWVIGIRRCNDPEGIYSFSGGWEEVCFDRQGQGKGYYHTYDTPTVDPSLASIQASLNRQGRLIIDR